MFKLFKTLYNRFFYKDKWTEKYIGVTFVSHREDAFNLTPPFETYIPINPPKKLKNLDLELLKQEIKRVK